MCLFLIFLLCSAVGDNFRFGVFNSRLGRFEFPVSQLRELARKVLICLSNFSVKQKVCGEIDEIPGSTGKTGNWSSRAEGVAVRVPPLAGDRAGGLRYLQAALPECNTH
jgi:hypothetical protein